MLKSIDPKRAFAAVTGVGAVLGALKWISEALSGNALPPQAILYYVTIGVFALYVMVAPALVGAALAAQIDEDEDAVLILGGLLGAALGVYFAIQVVNGFTTYHDASGGVRAYGAVIGFVLLGLAVYAYQRADARQAKSSS